MRHCEYGIALLYEHSLLRWIMFWSLALVRWMSICSPSDNGCQYSQSHSFRSYPRVRAKYRLRQNTSTKVTATSTITATATAKP